MTIDNGRRTQQVQAFEETLPNGKSYVVHEIGNFDRVDNTPIITVPEGHYFMMGDNKGNSKDSRFLDIGTIPAQNLIGRAEFMFFSTDQSAAFWEVWKWPFAIRYSRILSGIN